MNQGKWWDTLVIMYLENTGWGDVQNTRFVRYFEDFGTIFTGWSGVTHPSGPNYRAWLSGQTWSGNEFDSVKRPNLADTLNYTVFAWAGEPAQRHNPFLDMNPADPRASTFHERDLFVPTQLRALGSNLIPPPLIYLGLDDANNAHSAPLVIADNNAMAALDAFDKLDLKPARLRFFLTFDEAFGNEYQTNHVFAAMSGWSVPNKKTVNSRLTHFHLAQHIADNFGIDLHASADPTASAYAGQDLVNLV